MKLDSKEVSRIINKVRQDYKDIVMVNSNTENPQELMQRLTLCVFNLGRVDALHYVANAFSSEEWVAESLKKKKPTKKK